jgi:hypothetical protein
MSTLLTETTSIDLATQEERAAGPGLIEVRFYLTQPIDGASIQDIRSYLGQNGVDVRSVSQGKAGGLNYVSVIYNKPAIQPETISFLPVAVIPLIAFGFVSVLVGFGIWKIEDITSSVGKLALIIFGGTIVLVALLRKPIERAMEKF